MDILFLGTSSGTPTKSRNVTAIALIEEQRKNWYLIDCGEGTQHQLLHTKLSINALQAICITHIHGDHCYGLPGLLASAGMSGREQPLKIIAPKGIKEWFEATQTHTQMHLPFELEFIETEALANTEFQSLTIGITKLSHRVPSYAYSFTENNLEATLNSAKLIADGIPKGPLWGKIQKGVDVEHEGGVITSNDYLIHDKTPRKIIVSGDNDTPELLSEACIGANVLIHEATYTKDIAEKVGPGVGHSYAELVAQFGESVKIPNLVLTHFSARYQPNENDSPSINDIYTEAKNVFTGGLFLAEDFARYRLDKAGGFKIILE